MAERAWWGYPAPNTPYAAGATMGSADGAYGRLFTKSDDGISICHNGVDMAVYGTNVGPGQKMDDRLQASTSQTSTRLSDTMDARDQTAAGSDGVPQQTNRGHRPHTRRAVA